MLFSHLAQFPLISLGNTKLKLILLVASGILVGGCGDDLGLSKDQRAALYKAHEKAVEKCNAKWLDKSRVPIRGSRYVLDATKLPWEMEYSMWTKDEECGAATINDTFYWTGKEIISQKMWTRAGHKPTELPQYTHSFIVKALLGAPPDSVKHCKQHPDDCKGPPGPPVEWPAELVVRLKYYEDLEVRMFKREYLVKLRPTDVTHQMDIVLRGWPKEDGSPRTMFCGVRQNVFVMTREDIENFNNPTSCQLEFWAFKFNGGSARVVVSGNTYGNTLRQIVPALHALHQYFNDHITEEQP